MTIQPVPTMRQFVMAFIGETIIHTPIDILVFVVLNKSAMILKQASVWMKLQSVKD
jgi:hypothetical protein